MKKYILVILSVMLILNFTSCTKKDLPVNITIEGKELSLVNYILLIPVSQMRMIKKVYVFPVNAITNIN